MTSKTFNVTGMSCAHCKAAVEAELNGLPGIERSEADVTSGAVEVSYDGKLVSPGDIRAAVAEAGYAVEE